MNREDVLEMIVNKVFIELPICPRCGELTVPQNGKLPCCGCDEKEVKMWVRLVPVDIIES